MTTTFAATSMPPTRCSSQSPQGELRSACDGLQAAMALEDDRFASYLGLEVARLAAFKANGKPLPAHAVIAVLIATRRLSFSEALLLAFPVEERRQIEQWLVRDRMFNGSRRSAS